MGHSPQDLCPHEALLLACVKVGCPETRSALVDSALSHLEMDWGALVRTSIQHGVAQLVDWHLRDYHDDPRVPLEIANCFRTIYAATEFRNSVIFRETGRLLRALEQASVPCLVLKGVALALSVYPEHPLRNFADIDILVDPSRWEEAGAIAEQCGFVPDMPEAAASEYHRSYTRQAPEDILTGTLAPAFEPMHGSEKVMRDRHRVALEIHRGVFRLPDNRLRDVDMAPFWENPQKAVLPDGHVFHAPGQEAMLVHLASHAGGHAYGRLLFSLDIRLALDTYKDRLNWELLTDLAHRYEARQDLHRLMDMAQCELGASIPPAALRKLMPSQGVRDGTLRATDIFMSMRMANQERGTVTWSRLQQEQSVRERIVTAWQIVFPPQDLMRRYYETESPLRIGAWYLIRPFQMSLRFVRMMAQMLYHRFARRRGNGKGFL